MHMADASWHGEAEAQPRRPGDCPGEYDGQGQQSHGPPALPGEGVTRDQPEGRQPGHVRARAAVQAQGALQEPHRDQE